MSCCGVSASQFEKVQDQREIRKQLGRVDKTYHSFFDRRMRENGWAGNQILDQQTLRRDVLRVNEVMKKSGRFIIQPHSQFMLWLDTATTFCLIFTAIITPYEIAFLAEAVHLVLDVMNYVVFAVFIIGMIT